MPGILFATHGGATADGAGRVAALLASRLGTTLSTLCVIEPLRIVDGGFAAMYVPTPEEDEKVRSSLRTSVVAQLQRCGVSAPVQIRTGYPAPEIAAVARDSNAELIVLGIGRHQFLERALGNETALQLAQLASTPVLAIPASMTTVPRRIVAAIDFSVTSVAAAKTCARWLSKGDTLHLVYIAGAWHGDLPLEQRINAETVLQAISHQIETASGVHVEVSVVEGDTPQRIFDFATTANADLIALGSHGYGFWKRLALGSVASKVLRLSPIAVLVNPVGSVSATSAFPNARRTDMASV